MAQTTAATAPATAPRSVREPSVSAPVGPWPPALTGLLAVPVLKQGKCNGRGWSGYARGDGSRSAAPPGEGERGQPDRAADRAGDPDAVLPDLPADAANRTRAHPSRGTRDPGRESPELLRPVRDRDDDAASGLLRGQAGAVHLQQAAQ